MEGFLNKYKIQKETNEKPITHTSMKGGKWSIPQKKLNKFYKLIHKLIQNDLKPPPLVEKMNDYFPFVITVTESKEPKPSPEPYLEAMDFLSLDAKHTLMQEQK